MALPRLYGAPAYARPPKPDGIVTPRPIDPDDLPLELEMTADERQLIAGGGGPFAPVCMADMPHGVQAHGVQRPDDRRATAEAKADRRRLARRIFGRS